MYSRILLLASLLASTVASIEISGLPECAGDCVPADFGGCKQFNVRCICTNNDLLTNLACCVSKNCNKQDQDTTIAFANAICKGQDVTDLPQTATCASTATASSSTGTSGNSQTMPMTSGTMDMSSGTMTMSSGTAAAASSSSPTGAAPTDRVRGVGLGMVVAGLVAAM